MKVYRLYTERKNLKWVCGMVSEYFGGFTVYKALGYWQGKPEKSVVVEIITSEVAAAYKIKQIVLKIKGYNDQDAVLVTETEINVEVK